MLLECPRTYGIIVLSDLERNGNRKALTVLYEEFEPLGEAVQHIESYWRFTPVGIEGSSDHAIIPDGLVSISAAFQGRHLAGVLVSGPAAEAHVVPVQAGLRYAGMRFLPGSAMSLLGIDPVAVAGQVLPIGSICPSSGRWASAALADFVEFGDPAHLDAAIAERAHNGGPVDPVVAAASGRLIRSDGRISITALIAETGLSDRQFRTRFLAAAGLAPKTFARVRRQRAAWKSLARKDAGSLADASQIAGYADQPHFSRETQRAFGTSARRVQRYIRKIDHKFD
ncbi:helix-turn-helix domain-containing protein [Tsuneonella sp. SYSU-LHT278]|uniref:helix-turn-helix transcriptional regulator n=1 Tax=Tsuneonella sediminis TaxID=3416089 RepID=UPI003F7A36BB